MGQPTEAFHLEVTPGEKAAGLQAEQKLRAEGIRLNK